MRWKSTFTKLNKHHKAGAIQRLLFSGKLQANKNHSALPYLIGSYVSSSKWPANGQQVKKGLGPHSYASGGGLPLYDHSRPKPLKKSPPWSAVSPKSPRRGGAKQTALKCAGAIRRLLFSGKLQAIFLYHIRYNIHSMMVNNIQNLFHGHKDTLHNAYNLCTILNLTF